MTITVKSSSRAYKIPVRFNDILKSDDPAERDYRRGVLGEGNMNAAIRRYNRKI